MKRFFQKLLHNCTGAVTVFVTLLLIPAVLVSGTGVDIARIYTARSVLQDGNQLAANSVLASYDALLQDLYGLYGVMKDDPEFARMADSYIQAAVLGKSPKDTGLGTFQLFYGSDLQSGDVVPADGMNLDNPQVLRRQIEEYAKFRAPVIIVQEILGRLDVFQSVQEDAKVIQDKLEVDQKVEQVEKIYRSIYDCIQKVNEAKGQEESAIASVNSYLDQIRQELQGMIDAREGYTAAFDAENENLANDYKKKFDGHKENIRHLIDGGTVYQGWVSGSDSSGSWKDGGWTSSYYENGLIRTIRNSSELLEDFIMNETVWKNDSLEELANLCERAQSQKEELETLVDNLEERLNSGKCSADLKNGIMVEKDKEGKTILEHYRELLQYDVDAMGKAVQSYNEPQIQQVISMLENLTYGGTSASGTSVDMSLESLKILDGQGYEIDLEVLNRTLTGEARIPDKLSYAATVSGYRLVLNSENEFRTFQDSRFQATQNETFYAVLEQFYRTGGDSGKKDNLESGLENILGSIQSKFTTFLEFDPLGATKYNNGAESAGYQGTDFGSAGDWGSEDGATEQAQDALNSNLFSRLSNLAGDAADKLLLLTYDTEMFSCYATNSGETEDEPLEENMNGIPLSVDVNYYFQSELEYLYNGDLTNARNNLKAVTSMIFLVRFVFNYIASFNIDEVNATVNMVKTSLSWAGPFAVVAGELVRLAMALGESVIDVSRLKDGDAVALYKTDGKIGEADSGGTWQFSLSGMINDVTGEVSEISDSSFNSDTNGDDDATPSLRYKDYLRLFLLLVDGDTLAQRTAKLIELNVTNKRNNFGDLGSRSEREEAMASAELFDLSNAVTGFSLTTTVDLRMLFLSMPFAQRGVNGVVPPGYLSLTATDYRGY